MSRNPKIGDIVYVIDETTSEIVAVKVYQIIYKTENLNYDERKTVEKQSYETSLLHTYKTKKEVLKVKEKRLKDVIKSCKEQIKELKKEVTK